MSDLGKRSARDSQLSFCEWEWQMRPGWWDEPAKDSRFTRRALVMLAARHLEDAYAREHFTRSFNCFDFGGLGGGSPRKRFGEIEEILQKEGLEDVGLFNPVIPRIKSKWQRELAELEDEESACPVCIESPGRRTHGNCELEPEGLQRIRDDWPELTIVQAKQIYRHEPFIRMTRDQAMDVCRCHGHDGPEGVTITKGETEEWWETNNECTRRQTGASILIFVDGKLASIESGMYPIP